MYGSGGSRVASIVADALGWHLLDNNVVDTVAQRLGITPAEVSERDERVPSLVERLVQALTLAAPEPLTGFGEGAPPAAEEQIVEVTKRVIEEAVLTGNVVVVGRGAHWA